MISEVVHTAQTCCLFRLSSPFLHSSPFPFPSPSPSPSHSLLYTHLDMHILVTGANRGIGLGLVRELLKHDEVKNVFATHRHWADTKELMAIDDPRLKVYEMELMEHITIGSVYVKIRDTVGDDGLNCIINNAGIFDAYDMNGPVKRKLIVDEIEVNSVGPTILNQGFLPQLRKAIRAGDRAMMVNISDEMGSMTLCRGQTDRKALIYQMSKASVNMLTRSLAADCKKENVIYLAMAPGSVKTDMGGPNAKDTVEEVTRDMVDSILNKITIDHTGGFYDRKMNTIPF